MNLNETLCYLSKELEGKSLQFDSGELETLKKCFQMIEQDVKILELEKDGFSNNDVVQKIETVNKSLLILINALLNRTLPSNRIQFIVAFSQFVFNWNQNTIKLESIDLLARFIYQHVSLVEQMRFTITTLRKATTAYQDLKNWMPPAFDISKAYFDELISKKFKAG